MHLSFIVWQDYAGFLYSTGGFLRLDWYPINSFVNISIYLSNVIKLFAPIRLGTPPTAFTSHPAQVNAGLNYFPKATLVAGFF